MVVSVQEVTFKTYKMRASNIIYTDQKYLLTRTVLGLIRHTEDTH